MGFEKAFGKALQGTLSGLIVVGQWIEFADENGQGWAQPDIYVVQEDQVVLFECKLTYVEEAWPQMHALYVPLLMALYRKPVLCVQVCKNLIPGAPRSNVRLQEALRPDGLFHWLGGILL